METCESPFLIWFTGRTGSTYLCDLLNSHPEISCKKEQFVEVKIEDGTEFPKSGRKFTNNAGEFGRRMFDGSEAIDDPSEEVTLNYLSSILNAASRACGFKLKFPNQSWVYPEVVNALKQVSRLKVIELIRGNVLKQAISLRNVSRIKATGSFSSCNATKEVNLEPVVLDVELTKLHAQYFSRTRKEFCEFSKQFASVLPVRYEQILDDQTATLKRILEFLEVDENIKLESMFKKSTPDRLRDAVANYDELVAAVQGTELEQYLD